VRKTRWALLFLLAAVIAIVVAGYYLQQQRNRLLAPAKPLPLPIELNSLAKNWTWSHSTKDRPQVEARAGNFRQIRESSRFELDDVELRIFSQAGDSYDLVRSSKAQFDQPAERLYSEGEVTITLALPAHGPPEPGRRYTEIRTSGLTYDNKSGVSETDRPVSFRFEDGAGRSTGALYDSANRYLWMKRDAEVTSGEVRIRAGEMHYREAENKIELRPWSRLDRGGQSVEAGPATLHLESGVVTRIEAEHGTGRDLRPGREVEFRSAWMEVLFNPQRTVESAKGLGGAEVVSRTASGVTKMSGQRVDLEFHTPPGASESQLTVAWLRDQARIESQPAPAPAGAQPEARVLTSEMVKLVMRPGGEDVQSVETLSAARLDFVPSQPAQWRRVLTSERMWAQYRPGNHLDTLRAFGKVHLRSDPPAELKPASPRLTWSDDMRELRQWSNFRYQEGPRQAVAKGARFDVAQDQVTLQEKARVWDEAGQTSAGLLVLDQKQDRFQAEGEVNSTHLEKASGAAKKPPASEALFASDRPVHATAHRMEARQGNRFVDYRGAARLWQDANSIRAEEILLDRQDKTLTARGGVVSVLVEGEEPARRTVTITADTLVYTDPDRKAFYSGNVRLRRDRMTVRCLQLEAWLRPSGEEQKERSRLERALARGRVEVVEVAAEQRPARRGYAEEAEYFSAEEKVTLRGGFPTVEQPGRGFTRGSELTYYINDDRLLVSGQAGTRSLTHQRLKPN
jgi:lipopolysaccharide export system protein LptA